MDSLTERGEREIKEKDTRRKKKLVCLSISRENQILCFAAAAKVDLRRRRNVKSKSQLKVSRVSLRLIEETHLRTYIKSYFNGLSRMKFAFSPPKRSLVCTVVTRIRDKEGRKGRPTLLFIARFLCSAEIAKPKSAFSSVGRPKQHRLVRFEFSTLRMSVAHGSRGKLRLKTNLRRKKVNKREMKNYERCGK